MARLPFAGTANDYTFSTYTLGASKLVALTGATLTFFDAETGGNQVTDLTDEQGNAISSVVVPDTGDIPGGRGPAPASPRPPGRDRLATKLWRNRHKSPDGSPARSSAP